MRRIDDQHAFSSRLCLADESKQLAKARRVALHVDDDTLAFDALGAFDEAAGTSNFGFAQRDVDALELDIAFGAVDDRVVGGLEGQARAIELGQTKVRRLGLAFRRDLFDRSGHRPDRAELSGEALDRSQIGVKRVLAAERRSAGLTLLPGPELARRFDLAFRNRVVHRRRERGRFARAQVLHIERVDVPHLGFFVGVRGNDRQLRIGGDQFADDESARFARSPSPPDALGIGRLPVSGSFGGMLTSRPSTHTRSIVELRRSVGLRSTMKDFTTRSGGMSVRPW